MATNTDYSFIVQQLERMSTKIDEIGKEVQLTNIEIAKLSGMKHTLNDFKTWKEGVEGVVNAEDLREMKNALSEVKKQKEGISNLEKELEHHKLSLGKEVERHREEVEKLNTFKTKAVTIGSILFVTFTTAITVIGWFIS